MKIVVALLAVAIMLASAAFAFEDKPAPKVGDKAPDFKLKGSDGKDYTLAQFKGKQAVVIAWFPKAFTGG
jgi:peroxiredoxin Q/BCP